MPICVVSRNLDCRVTGYKKIKSTDSYVRALVRTREDYGICLPVMNVSKQGVRSQGSQDRGYIDGQTPDWL